MSSPVDPQLLLVLAILFATLIAILGTLFTLHSQSRPARWIALVCRTLGGFLLLLGALIALVGIGITVSEVNEHGLGSDSNWRGALGGVASTVLVSALFGLPAFFVPRLRARASARPRPKRPLGDTVMPLNESPPGSSIERVFAPPARDEDEVDD